MASAVTDELARPNQWSGDAPYGSADPADPFERRFAATGAALLAVAITVPIAAGVRFPRGALQAPWLTYGLLASLLLGPGGIGVAAVSLGWRQIAFRTRQADTAAAQAVLRVFAAAAMLAYALIVSVPATASVLPATIGLVGGWFLLLWTILVPAAVPLRTHGASVFDAAVISAFLYFGGGQTAGWYPLYIGAIFYAGARFGVRALGTSTVVSVLGFAAVVLSSEFWRGQPALATGLLLALPALPALFGRALCRRATVRLGDAAATTASPETFDLRALVKQTLTPLQAKAVHRGIVLRWRVDPRLPYRAHGSGDALAETMRAFAEHAMTARRASNICLSLGPEPGDGKRTMMQLRADGLGSGATEGPESAALQRRIEAAGGSLRFDRLSGRRLQSVTNLPLTAVPDVVGPALNLERRPVLIATDDDEFARDLAEPLAMWNAEPRWPGGTDETAAEISKTSKARRPIVIIDGRERPLSALGLVRQAARRGTDAPFVLLVVDPDRLAGLAALDEGEIDGFIPAPPTEALLAKALSALPLPWGQSKPPADARPGQALDARALEMLRTLDGGAAFLGELMDAFRSDARQFVQRVEQAAVAGDSAQFAQGLTALRRAAGHLGGVDLCEMATSLQQLDNGELRVQGLAHTRRLEAEVDRLCEALAAIAAAEEPRLH